jgi:hypothetical protein
MTNHRQLIREAQPPRRGPLPRHRGRHRRSARDGGCILAGLPVPGVVAGGAQRAAYAVGGNGVHGTGIRLIAPGL